MDPTESSAEKPSGRRLFSPDVWACLAERLSLSERELQIVQGIFDDSHQEAIAAKLGISAHTVHTHIERLYHKLHVASRVELVVRIAQCHVLLCQDPDSPTPPLCPNYAAGKCPLSS